MRQFAQVISVSETENKAEVVIRKHSACGKCGKCDSGNNMKVTVDNLIGAKVGDVVILEMKESKLLNAALLIYLAPIIGLIVGYLTGVALGFNTEISRIILGFLLFGLAFFVARKFGQFQENKNNLKVTAIVN